MSFHLSRPHIIFNRVVEAFIESNLNADEDGDEAIKNFLQDEIWIEKI